MEHNSPLHQIRNPIGKLGFTSTIHFSLLPSHLKNKFPVLASNEHGESQIGNLFFSAPHIAVGLHTETETVIVPKALISSLTIPL